MKNAILKVTKTPSIRLKSSLKSWIKVKLLFRVIKLKLHRARTLVRNKKELLLSNLKINNLQSMKSNWIVTPERLILNL
jgi:hypothetical protein